VETTEFAQRLLDALDSGRCIVVAEIGSNFPPSPDVELLEHLARTAVECGADAVKFQDLFPIQSVPARPDSWRERTAPWVLSPDYIEHLREFCHAALDVPFGTSPFTTIACHRAADNDFVKVASSEAFYPERFAPLFWSIPPSSPIRPMFISIPTVWRGHHLGERHALHAAAPWARPPFRPVILACVASYPANSHVLRSWYRELEALNPAPLVGISSHVRYPDVLRMLDFIHLAPAVLELHLRVPGITPDDAPDAGPWSLTPGQFKEVVDAVRSLRPATAPLAREEAADG